MAGTALHLRVATMGLHRAGVDSADIRHYLGVLERRVSTRRTGSRWMLQSLAEMKERS